MDQLSTAIGLSNFNTRQPKSLADWNAQYEAFSVQQDWWFKAGVSLANWLRHSIVSAAKFTATPALRAAHA